MSKTFEEIKKDLIANIEELKQFTEENPDRQIVFYATIAEIEGLENPGEEGDATLNSTTTLGGSRNDIINVIEHDKTFKELQAMAAASALSQLLNNITGKGDDQ